MKIVRGASVTYGGREWRVVSFDPELDQFRIRRSVWDRASGTSRTIYATPASSTLQKENS